MPYRCDKCGDAIFLHRGRWVHMHRWKFHRPRCEEAGV